MTGPAKVDPEAAETRPRGIPQKKDHERNRNQIEEEPQKLVGQVENRTGAEGAVDGGICADSFWGSVMRLRSDTRE